MRKKFIFCTKLQISCLSIGKIHPQSEKNSLIVIASEGYLFVFDDFTALSKNAASFISHRNCGTLSKLPSSLSFSNYSQMIPPSISSNSPPASNSTSSLHNSASNFSTNAFSSSTSHSLSGRESLHTSFSSLNSTPSMQNPHSNAPSQSSTGSNPSFIAPTIVCEIPMNVSTVLIEDVGNFPT